MALIEGPTAWALGLVVVAVLVRLSLSATLKRNGKALRKPPDTLPIFGNGIRFLQPRQQLFSWFVRNQHHFGRETYQIAVPTLPPGVVISDPQVLDYVFKNEMIFAKGEFVIRRVWDLFGRGIINADGDMWRTQRKAGLHFLSSSNLRVLTEVALPQYLDDAVDELKEYAEDGEEFDLQEVFHDITTGLMGKMAYNMEMRPEKEFTAAFEYASGKSADRVQNPLWPVTEIFFGAQFRKALRIVKKFGKEIVTKAVHDRSSTNSPESEASSEKDEKLQEVSGSLIQSLLDALDDEEVVADAALNYLSAGRDTTAQTLTWAFYELMRNPRCMTKIRDEVSAIITSHSDTASDAPNSVLFTPTAMPYTTAVFYEALRLYPPIPVEIKQTFSPTTLPDGTFLPTGTVVVWCIWAVNRSRQTWDKDADVFRPERWLEDGKFVPRSTAEFPVFNGGARMCLGKRMAEVIGVQVIATMAWLFEFRNAQPGVTRWSGSSLTLPMEGGLPSFVSRRSTAVG